MLGPRATDSLFETLYDTSGSLNSACQIDQLRQVICKKVSHDAFVHALLDSALDRFARGETCQLLVDVGEKFEVKIQDITVEEV